MDYPSIYKLFEDVAAERGDKPAYSYKSGDAWRKVSWRDSLDLAHRISKGLMAQGVEHGDKVCILSGTRFEWVICDLGCVSCGGVTVGIYHSNLPQDCAYIVNHSEAEVIFVENAEQLAKIVEVRDDLPALRRIVIFDGPGDPANDVLSWDEFLASGDGVTDEAAAARGEAVGPDDLASIVYTSGTTGVPKGAMITNHNLLFTSGSVVECLYLEPHFQTLMFLPLAHVFARLIVYSCLRYGSMMAFSEDITTVPSDLKEVRPHFMASVPRIYEKVHDKIAGGVAEAGGVKEKLFNWALGVGRKVSDRHQAKQSVPLFLGLEHALAEKLVLGKIQAAFGGQLAWAISGAAPLNPELGKFFHACGILILEGIGMTENTSFSHVNRFDNNRFGTVGQPGPGIEARIAADGEVLIRGDNVMKGYLKNEEETAETIDGDGWLLTGDIGVIDDDGFLKITDRKKDLIITAGGKNVAPQKVEQALRTSPFVAQIVAYGDKKKYLTALVTLDPAAIARWAVEKGLDTSDPVELAGRPEVRELIEGELAQRNRDLASYETIKRFHILDREFTIEDGELTPTMKVKRKVIVEKHRDKLEALYDA